MATNNTTSATGTQTLSVESGQNLEIALSAGQNLVLAAGDATVQGMTVSDSGALVLMLSNGSTVAITNFADASSMSPAPKLTLPNGQPLELTKLETMEFPAAETAMTEPSPTEQVLADAKDATVINAPNPGESLVVKLDAGEDYQFGFAMNAPKAVKETGGQLVITFENGGEIIIPNYGAVKNSGLQLTMNDGAELPVSDFGDILASATQLNQIEAAAGDAGGAAGARNGFGFQSAFQYTPFNSINPIGPINPTELQYRTSDREPDPTLGPAVSPKLTVNDSLVYEDGSTALDITATPNNGNEQITLTVTGIDPSWTVDTSISGGTYDAATGTWTITLPPGVSFSGGPIVSPPPDSDADMPGLTVTSTVTNVVTTQTVSVTTTVNVYTDAVADTPDLAGSDASGNEDTAIPLTITTAVTDTDGSEEITSVVISGVPDGATLNNGTDLGGGVWQLTQADLTGLTITPPVNYSGSFPLTITSTATEVNLSGTEFDLTNNEAHATTVINVTVVPVADPPTLEVQDAQVKEDGSVALQVSAALTDTDGSEYLTVSIAGIQPGWDVDTTASGGTYDAATGTWSVTLAPGVNFSGGPTLSPPADSDVDLTGLVVTATSTEVANGDAASTTDSIDVIVDAVIDTPILTAADITTAEGTPTALNISTATGESQNGGGDDGSEAITSVVISGVPAGFTLSAGTYDAGTGDWTLTQAELAGLTLNPPAHWSGTVNLTITSTAEEVNLSGAEWDFTDNIATVTESISVTFTPQADPPTLKVADEQVKEDGSVQLNIEASLNDPAEALTITIEGIQPGWGVDTTASGGTYDASTGTWTISLPTGVNFNGGPVFSPPADSDVDLTGLVVTATSTDSFGNEASVNDTVSIIVDAVIDTPILSASSPGGEEGDLIPLNIVTATGESQNGGGDDGSEEITSIKISGLPAGFALTAGTDLGGGVWELTPAELSGLKLITPSTWSHGAINLTVSVTATEVNLSGDEYDYTDNQMTVTTKLKVDITFDDNPIIVDPDKVVVDETDLSGVVTASGTINADFFRDGPGEFTPTGVGSFGVTGSVAGGVLTSEGHPVTVTLSGNTYTGTANGVTVFTLTVLASGAYTFNLLGTLDHADTSDPNDAINLQFGITATDADGDFDTTTLTVQVLDDGVTAFDDHNTFNTEDGGTFGNVITGLNGGPGAADDLSQDGPNTVTEVSFGSTTVTVPGSGSATIDGDYGTLEIFADGSYTYTLFPGAGTGTTTLEHDFDGSIEFPLLTEGVAYTGTEALGVLASDITVGHATTANVTFVSEGAGYSNTMGAYVVDPVTGVIGPASILFTNGNNVSAGDSASFDIPAGGGQLGFFIIADGFTLNSGYPGIDFSAGTLSFVNTATGAPATIHDNAADITLIFTDASGNETTLSGPVYHSTLRGGSTNLNPDGEVHTVSGASTVGDTNTLRIGFEDLPHLGDTDYEDFIFDLVVNDAVIPGTDCPQDEFVYTLVDGDGDNDTAVLTLKGYTPNYTPEIIAPAKQVVDETDLSGGDVVVNGTIFADFFGDGPGTFTATGVSSFTAAGSIAGGTLTSEGHPVTVSLVGNTYVGSANGVTVFTLDIQPNGEYQFNLIGTLDHADKNDHNDVINLQFGITATDADGDFDTTTLTVRVLDDGVTAYNDVNTYDTVAGTAEGNVITGLNGGPGAADSLSQDDTNTVTKVSFGATSVDVPQTGYATIDGDYGTLKIFADGSYEYTLFGGSAIGSSLTTTALEPVSSDVAGIQSSFTKNGITVASSNGADLKWVNTDGAGIGIAGGGSDKVWPSGETLLVSFDQPATTVTVTIADIGSNNLTSGIDFYVYVDGNPTPVSYEFDIGSTTPVGGKITIELDSADFGGQITGFDVFSVSNSSLSTASFLLNNVSTTYGTEELPCDTFTYTLTDGDGDSDTATLQLKGLEPTLIVGENVDDISTSTVPYEVGDGSGVITGGKASDILIGDVGGSVQMDQNKDYNIVLILDISGSMGSKTNANSQYSLLMKAVKNLMADFNDYNGGDVKVHIVPFSTTALAGGTFTVSDNAGFADAISFIDNMSNAGGWTNYESAMQAAIGWLESGDKINGAETYTYFVSDGEPNRYVTDSSAAVSGSESVSMGQIRGTDGTNEIEMLQSLSTEVIGVGINIGSKISNINEIDSNGVALNIDDPNDLSQALAGASPLNQLSSVGGDTLVGGDGNDIIFGDSVNTDTLAAAHGIALNPGSGWEVFAQLEAGQSTIDPSWSRADTILYIRDNAEELAAESIGSGGSTRSGGNDVIYGGDGDDLIFGQEGDDVIYGGSGNNTIYGGSGADTFVFMDGKQGVDTIKDFNAAEGDVLDISNILSGFDPLAEALTDYVNVNHVGGDTVVQIDVSGTGANFQTIAILEGVSVDLDTLTTNGNLIA